VEQIARVRLKESSADSVVAFQLAKRQA